MLEVARVPDLGQVVRVRQRQYLVEEVVPPPAAAEATLVRLACLDDDAQGQELEVLWEAEPDAEVLTGTGWDHLASRGFDPPRLFSAYLHTLRWNCVTATNPRLFQSPFRAGIKIDAYQIEPLRKALLLPTMTSSIVSAWTDRATDALRLNLQQNRPEVDEASVRVADYYRQRGMGGPASSQMASTVLGGFVKTEAMAHGIQSGPRFLCLIVGGAGLLVTALLAWSEPARSP